MTWAPPNQQGGTDWESTGRDPAGARRQKGDDPQEPRPVDRRASPPAPGRLGPWGSSAPRGTPVAFPRTTRESPVLRPRGRLDLATEQQVARTYHPRRAVRARQPFQRELRSGFPSPTASAPRGEAESRRRQGVRQGDVPAGQTRMSR